jgi:hypothetical protein
MERPWVDHRRAVTQKPLKKHHIISDLEYESETMALKQFRISKAKFHKILGGRGSARLRTLKQHSKTSRVLYCVQDLNLIILPALGDRKQRGDKNGKSQCSSQVQRILL